jgi:hypothetical protein
MWEEWEWDSGYREWFWSHRFSHPEMRCAGIYLRHRESFDLRRWRPYRNWKQFATERFLLKAALSAAQGKYLKSRWYELWADHFDYPGELMTPEAREEQGFPREDLGPETSLTPD